MKNDTHKIAGKFVCLKIKHKIGVWEKFKGILDYKNHFY